MGWYSYFAIILRREYKATGVLTTEGAWLTQDILEQSSTYITWDDDTRTQINDAQI